MSGAIEEGEFQAGESMLTPEDQMVEAQGQGSRGVYLEDQAQMERRYEDVGCVWRYWKSERRGSPRA